MTGCWIYGIGTGSRHVEGFFTFLKNVASGERKYIWQLRLLLPTGYVPVLKFNLLLFFS